MLRLLLAVVARSINLIAAFCFAGREIVKSTAPPPDLAAEDERAWTKSRMLRYGMIGGGAVAGGVVLAVTGGLAAPAVVAGLGLAGAAVAGAGAVGAGAAGFAASVAAFGGLSTALGVSFGAGVCKGGSGSHLLSTMRPLQEGWSGLASLFSLLTVLSRFACVCQPVLGLSATSCTDGQATSTNLSSSWWTVPQDYRSQLGFMAG